MEVLKNISEVFAYNLRNHRGRRTQSEIAEGANLSLRGYQRLEAGSIPKSPSTTQAVARALGVSESALFLDPDMRVATKPTPREAAEILHEYFTKGQAHANHAPPPLAEAPPEYIKAAEIAPKPITIARDPLEQKLGSLLASLDEREAGALRASIERLLRQFDPPQVELKPRKSGQ